MKVSVVSMSVVAMASAILFASNVEAQNLDVRSKEDAYLLVSSIRAGKEMPSQEALEVFNLRGTDRLALAEIIQGGEINMTRDDHRRVFMLALRPAMKLIYQMENAPAVDARDMGQDLVEMKRRYDLAYELIGAIGSPAPAAARAGAVEEERASIGDCLVSIVFDQFFVESVLGDEMFEQSIVIEEDFNARGVAVATLAIADVCMRRKNNKICSESSDPLVSDSCPTQTDKYCRLVQVTGGGGVRRCTQASDGTTPL